jgi:hypothetical protein
MRQNRKHQSGAVWFIPALKAFLLCSLLGGTAVGYVLQKNKIYELGLQITARERRLADLKEENKMDAGRLADLQLPHRLAERVREQKLGLGHPPPAQIIWLSEPPASASTNPGPHVVLAK